VDPVAVPRPFVSAAAAAPRAGRHSRRRSSASHEAFSPRKRAPQGATSWYSTVRLCDSEAAFGGKLFVIAVVIIVVVVFIVSSSSRSDNNNNSNSNNSNNNSSTFYCAGSLRSSARSRLRHALHQDPFKAREDVCSPVRARNVGQTRSPRDGL